MRFAHEFREFAVKGNAVEAAENLLTNAALDPYAKIPEFKFCAVKVAKASVN
jgi:hypothetical protein